MFRAGSRIRITVDAPGGNRAVWAFETIADGETVQLAIGGDHPSSIVLPVVPGVEVPPACTGVRIAARPALPHPVLSTPPG